jgi:multidrug efflux system membrane fusion protein
VDGQLLEVGAREGQQVPEGEVLARIDPRSFEVQIEQAEGQLAKDQAALRDAQLNLDRMQSLYEQQIVPQQQVDSQRAQVNEAEGALRADHGQLDNARLQLSYSRITAPFAGRIGLRIVDAGNMVRASDPNGLFVLTQVHPIAVVFSLPQDDLGEVLTKLKAGEALEVEAYDRDNARKLATGKLLTTDNQIDTSTGTYRLKAVFDNQDDALFPNQFVNARLHLDTRRGLVLVPAAAIQRGSSGTFVYVVDAEGTAHVRPVSVAISEGTDAGASQGLQPGDQVVVDGQDKLQDGSKVQTGGQEGGAGPAAHGARPRDARSGGRAK